MISTASSIEAQAASYLTAPAGPTFQLNELSQSLGSVPIILSSSIIVGTATPELMEQSLVLSYPIFTIYCDKLSNTLKEKFRTFSGTAQLTIDVRHSQDQLGGIQTVLENYVSATCDIFDKSRGDWGNGLFYRGGYDVSFAPVKKGGKSFLQTGKIVMTIDVSI